MGSYKPAVIVFIIALSVTTSGVAALQSADSGQSIVETSVQAAEQAQKSLEGESSTVTKTGGVSAAMSSQTTSNACPPGTYLLAKYNFEDTDDDADSDKDNAVFEKGSAGDVFDIDVTETDDGEPKEFTWVSNGPEVSYVYVKDDGDQTPDDKITYDPPTKGLETVGTADKTYSNVQFCLGQFYQVDLIQGQPESTLTDSNLYSPQNRLARAAITSERGVITHRGRQNFERSECLNVEGDIQVHADTNETSVTVSVPDSAPESCEGATFSLASYELPQGETGFALDQELQNSVEIEVGRNLPMNGTQKTFTIELSN